MIYFAQAIRERKTYTDFMIGLIMLTQYYKGYDKIFYIKGDIANAFENKNVYSIILKKTIHINFFEKLD